MKDLKRKATSAIIWDLLGTFIQRGFGFVISIVLARLLAPEEFGLVGMAMVFISITQVFIDVGFSSALIQNQKATALTYSSVFFLNVALGGTAFLLFFFAAPLVGSFYNNENITLLVRWLSLSFVLNSFNLVQTALLRKSLKFKTLTIRTALASATGGIGGIAAALYGLGVYSLVIQSLASAMAGTILLWTTSGWKPDLRFSYTEIKKVMGFSSYMFFDLALTRVFQKLDILIIGKLFSPALLGFYSRAETLRDQIAQYSSSSINKVFFPVLSSIQDDDEKFQDVYFKLLSIICFIAFGLTGVLYFIGGDLIILLFGKKWTPTVPIYQVLILAAVNRPINSLMVTSLLGKGLAKKNFFMGLYRKVFSLAPFLFLIVSFEAYLYAMVFFAYFLTISIIVFVNKSIHLSVKENLITIMNYAWFPVGSIALFYFLPSKFNIDVPSWLFTPMFLSAYMLLHKVLQSQGYKFSISTGNELVSSFVNKSKSLKSKLKNNLLK